MTESKSLSGGERASHRALIKGGMKAAWPICICYIPLGFAFGVLAQKGGFSVLDIAIMSVVVFAGSSQFIHSYALCASPPHPFILRQDPLSLPQGHYLAAVHEHAAAA